MFYLLPLPHVQNQKENRPRAYQNLSYTKKQNKSYESSLPKLKLTGRIDIHPPLCPTDLVLVSTALGVALRVIDEGLHWGRIVATEALSHILNPGVCVTVVLLTAALDAPEGQREQLIVCSEVTWLGYCTDLVPSRSGKDEGHCPLHIGQSMPLKYQWSMGHEKLLTLCRAHHLHGHYGGSEPCRPRITRPNRKVLIPSQVVRLPDDQVFFCNSCRTCEGKKELVHPKGDHL